jgi:hypothetical protein
MSLAQILGVREGGDRPPDERYSREPRSDPSQSESTVDRLRAATVELIVRLRKDLAGRALDAGPPTICWQLEHHHQMKVFAPGGQAACAARVYQMCW